MDEAETILREELPNGGEEATHRSPKDIMYEIAELDVESAKVLRNFKALL